MAFKSLSIRRDAYSKYSTHIVNCGLRNRGSDSDLEQDWWRSSPPFLYPLLFSCGLKVSPMRFRLAKAVNYRVVFGRLKPRSASDSFDLVLKTELRRRVQNGFALGFGSLSQRANGTKFSLFRKQRAALRASSFGWGCRHRILFAHRDLTRFCPRCLVKNSVTHGM